VLLVLESSTTSAKAMLFDAEKRRVVGTLERAYPKGALADEGGTHHAEAVFAETAALGREILRTNTAANIEAIIPGGIFHSVLVCDSTMRPLTPTYTWMYTGARGTTLKKRQSASYVKSFYQRTGCMVHAMYAVFQLLHLKENGFNFSNTFVMSQSAYNAYRLTEKLRESASTLSGMGLANTNTRGLDDEILAEIGLAKSQFGELAEYTHTVPLSKSGAEILGLHAGIPVLVSHPDGALNQVGSGALVEGVMTCSIGTSAAIRLSRRAPLIPEAGGTWCYMSPAGWMSGAATNGACNCVDWIKPLLFAAVPYAEIEKTPPDYRTMPYFLPFLFGERCPGWDDEREGVFASLSGRHGAKDMYFSVLEGILFNLYHCYTTLTAVAGRPKEIKLSGGILNSKEWTRMAAGIFGEPLSLEKVSNASMMGAAVLGMAVTGHLAKIEDWKTESLSVVSPEPELREIFMARYQRYLELYQCNAGQ